MSTLLNIAHCVEFYPPSLGGMQEVVKQLSERMVRAGHRVTVFTTQLPERKTDEINGVRIQAFNVSGNSVRGIVGDIGPYRQALIDGNFDVVTFFAAQQWTTDAMLPHLTELNAVKVFVPTGFSGLHVPMYADYYRHMPAWMKAMDVNVFLSDSYQDVVFAREHGVVDTVLIPNGAAEEEFDRPLQHDVRKEYGITKEDTLLVHIGSYTGAKGQWEAIQVFLAAERTKGATLMLIGNGMKEFKRLFHAKRWFVWPRLKAWLTKRRILFLELDRSRTVDALRQADLFFFPSQVECSPIVLFEAMAAGTPFLSSNAGNSAEIAQWSNGGWILPGTRTPQGIEKVDVQAGARMLDQLLKDRSVLKTHGGQGHEVWKARFTWSRITDEYLAQYRHLVHARNA
jgi:L-malate glycosyltransferase